ncbi:DUF6059 family protein [Streptomyces sp. NPDC021093]|uniref:DUF6059 family protein n=1 Tax=Streptomyces sp. NPDC021093 TaxID=3365112 RepID=UPI00378C5528
MTDQKAGYEKVWRRACRTAHRAVLCPLWQGVIILGQSYLAGEVRRHGDTGTARSGRRAPYATAPYATAPYATAPYALPAGHPERLRPDLPLTDLERVLLRQLDLDPELDPDPDMGPDMGADVDPPWMPGGTGYDRGPSGI